MSLGSATHKKDNYVNRTLLIAAKLSQCEILANSKFQVHQNKRKGRYKGEKKREIKKEDGEKEEEKKKRREKYKEESHIELYQNKMICSHQFT